MRVTAVFRVTLPAGKRVIKTMTMTMGELAKLERSAIKNRFFFWRGRLRLWKDYEFIRLASIHHPMNCEVA